MPTATAMLRVRWHPRLGPALRRTRVPLACIVLSSVFHAGLIAAFVLAADIWQSQESKTYVINLVPAIAAAGTPAARRTEPSPTPVAPQAETRAPSTAPPELPARGEATRTPDLPARDARALPPRESALPRASEKESPPTTLPATTAPRREAAVPQVGRPNGSPQGAGPVTLDVDFPYAWYIQAVTRKISENWDDQARDVTQPVIVFEIGRNGQVGSVKVEKTSGNALYDQAAIRAVRNANPFPNLPDDFKASVLRVHLSFGYTQRQG